MANFSKAIGITLQHEGYYSNVEGDLGGETYRGVSRKWNPGWLGWSIVDREKRQNGGKLTKNYKIEDDDLTYFIEQIYKEKYWMSLSLDEVTLQELANLMFDTYVHSGTSGVMLIQEAVNASGYYPVLVVDGAYGPKTLQGVKTVDQHLMYDVLREKRRVFLLHRSRAKHQGRFLNGWMARVDSFKDIA